MNYYRVKHNKLKIRAYSYSDDGAAHSDMHFIIHPTIMRPEDYELSNVDINVRMGIAAYKNGVRSWMHAVMLPISGTY